MSATSPQPANNHLNPTKTSSTSNPPNTNLTGTTPSLLDIVSDHYNQLSYNRCSRLLLGGILNHNYITHLLNDTECHKSNMSIQHYIIQQYTYLLDQLKSYHQTLNIDTHIQTQNNQSNNNNNSSVDDDSHPLTVDEMQQQMTGLLVLTNENQLVLLLESSTEIIVDLLRAHSKNKKNEKDKNDYDEKENHKNDKSDTVDVDEWIHWNDNEKLGHVKKDEDGNDVTAEHDDHPTPISSSLFLSLKTNHPISELFSELKVLSFSENIPREYNCYTSRQVHMDSDTDHTYESESKQQAGEGYKSPSQQDDYDADLTAVDSSHVKEIFDTLRQLLEIGRDTSQMSMDKAIDYIQNTNSRLLIGRLPTSQRIDTFMSYDELCQPHELLEIYDNPLGIPLHNEAINSLHHIKRF